MNGGHDPSDDPVRVLEHVVLPHPTDTPSKALELPGLADVSLHVGLKLLRPEIVAASRAYIVLRTTMPEAPVNEHGNTRAREDDVRPPDLGAGVESVAEAMLP